MLQWCLQIKLKYFISLIIALFLTYWMFGISSYELIPQWHISLPASRFYPFHVKKVDSESMRIDAVSDDDHFYHFLVQLRRIPRLELLPEALPMHAMALPAGITKIKAFDVKIINTMQYLILLCENSSVYALDDNFNIRWQSQVFSKTEGFTDSVEAGFVSFLDTCLSPGKCNYVLVGVSLLNSYSHGSSKGHGDHGQTGNAAGKHLSTVVFDAETGELIWHHMPYDYGFGLENESDRLAPSVRHHWKLKILRTHLRMEHIDERPWVSYLPFFMELLPYSWVRPHDTEIHQTSLRHHWVDSKPKQKMTNEQRDTGRANVIVVRHEKGLEVLDLFTGKPRSHLEMDSGIGKTFFRDASRLLMATVHTHLNETNGIVCRLQVIPRSTVGAGSSHVQLQWDNLCAPIGILGTSRPFHDSYREDPLKLVPPVVIDRYKVWPELFRFLGVGFSYRNTKDIITLLSDGKLNSYSTDGNVNWRTNVPVSWLPVSRDIASGEIPEKIRDLYRNLFVPSLTRLKPSENQWQADVVIAVGWNSLALIDVQDGSLLASHDLPCQPIYRAIVLDDHLIVACHTMIVGFHMKVALKLITFFVTFIGLGILSIICVCCLDSKSVLWDLID